MCKSKYKRIEFVGCFLKIVDECGTSTMSISAFDYNTALQVFYLVERHSDRLIILRLSEVLGFVTFADLKNFLTLNLIDNNCMATSGSYNITQAATITRTSRHIATAAGTGYSDGDVLGLTQVLNGTTGAILSSFWVNLDTETPIAAPTLADVIAYNSDRKVVGNETLTVSGVTPFAAIATGATHAEIHVWDGDITYAASATPSATVGTRQGDGQTFELESKDEITGFNAFDIAGTPRLDVTYYKIYGFGGNV